LPGLYYEPSPSSSAQIDPYHKNHLFSGLLLDNMIGASYHFAR
jgi:hypothetical protein